MKQDNYKPLGQYIQQTDVRNTDLCECPLLGVSVEKVLIPSVANTIGTDFSKYKILYPNEFVYIADTSRRGDKIAIALNNTGNPALVSSAYTTFKVDEDYLLSDYLMLWVSRPEFDRYARFMSHGSVRELFSWEEMCNVLLPIPPIEEQHRIVSEYQTVERRIKNNEAMIQKLEETAQAIYHHTFVEGIDDNNLPEGWKKDRLGSYVELSQGIQVDVEEQFMDYKEGRERFVRIIDYTPNSSEPPRYVDITDKRYYCSEDEISMIRYGDAGKVCRRISGIIANNLFKISPIHPLNNNYLYYFLKDPIVEMKIRGCSSSSTMPAITHSAIKDLEVLLPPSNIFVEFNRFACAIEKSIILYSRETSHLRTLLSLLTSKLS